MNERNDWRLQIVTSPRERQSNIAMPTIVESARQKRSEHTFNSSWTTLQFNAAAIRTQTTYTRLSMLDFLSTFRSIHRLLWSLLRLTNNYSYIERGCNDSETRTIRDYCLQPRLLYQNHSPRWWTVRLWQELCFDRPSIVGYCESYVMQITTRMGMLESSFELRIPFAISGEFSKAAKCVGFATNSTYSLLFLTIVR